METNRDKLMLSYLEQFKVMKTEQIHKLCYSNVKLGYVRQRLKKLFERGDINRNQSNRHLDQSFIYYTGKFPPKQVNHKLKLVDIFISIKKFEYLNIKDFQVEYTLDNLRADGYMEVVKGSELHLFFIEIHQFNMFNFDKYITAYANNAYIKYAAFPKVLIVTNQKATIPKSDVKFILIKEDMSNIREAFI